MSTERNKIRAQLGKHECYRCKNIQSTLKSAGFDSVGELVARYAERGQRLEKAFAEITRLAGSRELLAEAERLCMEHCPDEMSEALRADWAAHQKAAPITENAK